MPLVRFEGAWGWDRKQPDFDVTRLVAVNLAGSVPPARSGSPDGRPGCWPGALRSRGSVRVAEGPDERAFKERVALTGVHLSTEHVLLASRGDELALSGSVGATPRNACRVRGSGGQHQCRGAQAGSGNQTKFHGGLQLDVL